MSDRDGLLESPMNSASSATRQPFPTLLYRLYPYRRAPALLYLLGVRSRLRSTAYIPIGVGPSSRACPSVACDEPALGNHDQRAGLMTGMYQAYLRALNTHIST